MAIICIDRVIVAVRDLVAARENCARRLWCRSGRVSGLGMRIARLAAGAVEIDLCQPDGAGLSAALAEPLRASIEAGGGIVGWVWGKKNSSAADAHEANALAAANSIKLPGQSSPAVEAAMPLVRNAGVIAAAMMRHSDIESRRRALLELCGTNANTVEYLEHIVVMTPVLEDAIAANEANECPLQANPRSRQRCATGVLQAGADGARSRRSGARQTGMLGNRAHVRRYRASRRHRTHQRIAGD